MSGKTSRLDRIEKRMNEIAPRGPRYCFVSDKGCDSDEEWLDVYAPRTGESDDERRKRQSLQPKVRIFFDGKKPHKEVFYTEYDEIEHG